jgi:hypothetical protein
MDAKRGVRQHVFDDAVDLYRFFLSHRYSVREGLRKMKAGPAHWPSPALTFAGAGTQRARRTLQEA